MEVEGFLSTEDGKNETRETIKGELLNTTRK